MAVTGLIGKVGATVAGAAKKKAVVQTPERTKTDWQSAVSGSATPAASAPATPGGTTSYIDANGIKRTGYYADGKTYADAEHTTRVPVGSIVDTAGGKYLMTENGGVPYSDATYAGAQQTPQAQNYMTDYLGKLENGYEEILAQQQRAAKAAAQQGINGLEGQKEDIDAQYANLFRQLYINRRMAERDLPQQMAAMGYSGGMTESSALGLKTSYEEALRQGESGRIAAIGDLDTQIANARLTGDLSAAEQAAALAQQKLTSYGDVLAQLQSQRNYEDEFSYQKAQDALAQQQSEAQALYSRQQQAAEDTASAGWTLLKAGIAPSDAQLGTMGVTRAQAESYLAALRAEAAASGKTSYRKEDNTPKYTDVEALFQAMEASGYPYAYLDANYGKYGIGEEALGNFQRYYKDWTQEKSGTLSSEAERIYNEALQRIAFKGATADTIRNFIEDMTAYGNITAREAAAIEAALGIGG